MRWVFIVIKYYKNDKMETTANEDPTARRFGDQCALMRMYCFAIYQGAINLYSNVRRILQMTACKCLSPNKFPTNGLRLESKYTQFTFKSWRKIMLICSFKTGTKKFSFTCKPNVEKQQQHSRSWLSAQEMKIFINNNNKHRI